MGLFGTSMSTYHILKLK